MARYRVGLETRERILDATREVLGELGLENATLKAITERAEVGAGSFYNLFDSKEEAVLEVLRQAIVAVDPDPAGVGRESLDDLIEAFVAFVTGPDAALARIYLQMASQALSNPAVAARLNRSHRHRVGRFAAAIQRESMGVDAVEATAHAELLLAALMGLAFVLVHDPLFDFPGHAARLPRRPGVAAQT